MSIAQLAIFWNENMLNISKSEFYKFSIHALFMHDEKEIFQLPNTYFEYIGR